MVKCIPLTALILAVAAFVYAPAVDAQMVPAGEIVVDRSTRSKSLNDYTLLTRDAIQREWTHPVALTVPNAVKGRIGIDYAIRSDGALESAELVRGSGNPELDRTLLQAIRAAGPFPPFPEDVHARRIVIRANFIVADLPTLPAGTVEYDVAPQPETEGAAPDRTDKKFIWGVPAGTGNRREGEAESSKPAPPDPVKKYRWGMTDR
jgi:TonB family protein